MGDEDATPPADLAPAPPVRMPDVGALCVCGFGTPAADLEEVERELIRHIARAHADARRYRVTLLVRPFA